MEKLKAIEYLVSNDKENDEWSGAGMWHAVVDVITRSQNPTKEHLDMLLQEAENF